jgi:hypothetical protein
MKTHRLLFWVLFCIGLAIYVGAFFLPAVGEQHGPGGVRGYICAEIALVTPWGHDGWDILHDYPFRYFCLLISGWINPIFLITALLLLVNKARKLAAVLRIILLMMIPFCWIVFHYENLSPRLGHFLWILGMLLVLFANKISTDRVPSSNPQ